MVYYLKYRPQTLSDIVGQKQVKDLLRLAFLNNKLAHAYLFCGLRGTGKTSTARILAKMVNCEKQLSADQKPEDYPCNKCLSCVSITNGSNLDLVEIDAASNRGIDDIRELRERIKLAPTSSKKKVYIIDEAHMLTTDAFNALLKTLEEPPEHVLFILATTEEYKIPQTIMSRVQRLDFKQANVEDLALLLTTIAKKENIKIDDDAIKLLAKKGDGSFRDVLKFLEQLATTDENITLEVVEKNLLSGSFEDVVNLLKLISQKNPKTSLEFAGKLFERGIDIREYILSILDTLRVLLLIKHQVLDAVKEDLGSARFSEVMDLSDKFSIRDLTDSIDFFIKAFEKTKSTSHPTLPLEIAIVESSRVQISEVRSQISDSAAVIASPAKQSNPEIATDSTTLTTGYPRNDENSDLPKLLDKWTYILETIKPYNYSLEALLKQAKIISCVEELVILEVPYSFHQRILESPKNRSLLESVLSDVLEKEIKVNCILGVRPVRIEELANVELAADDEVIRIAAEIFNSEPSP